MGRNCARQFRRHHVSTGEVIFYGDLLGIRQARCHNRLQRPPLAIRFAIGKRLDKFSQAQINAY
jgi:hypothetical protein